MKKSDVIIGKVISLDFPNRGTVLAERIISGPSVDSAVSGGADSATDHNIQDSEKIIVKNVIPGQTVKVRIVKKAHGQFRGNLLSVITPSELESASADVCPHFSLGSESDRDGCGGCLYQSVPYDEEIRIKTDQIRDIFADELSEYDIDFDKVFEGVRKSPESAGYRNKMEFTFGDAVKDGPLTLGLHKRASTYDIVSTAHCRLCHSDFGVILKTTQDFFRERHIPFYHKITHQGYLRHLLVRRAHFTGEILIDLVTADYTDDAGTKMDNQEDHTERTLLNDWTSCIIHALQQADTDVKIAGILHTRNNNMADAIRDEGTEVLYGRGFFYEELLGLKFKITPFSFFQTNSAGAEVLYSTAREFILSAENDSIEDQKKTVYDLYSGTGTIAQMLSPAAAKVIGVEIVPEAVEAAKENARLNKLENCEFLTGDVLKTLDTIEDKPDLIVLDPPREGINPKALPKLISYGVDTIIYISCKATSLAHDLPDFLSAGYTVKRMACVDMFPRTPNVECVVQLSRA